MEMKPEHNPRRREGRSHAERLTVELPIGMMTALKIHAAQRETTIRALVTDLVQTVLEDAPTQAPKPAHEQANKTDA